MGQFLRGIQPSDIFELTVERTTGRRRPKWERIFGGTLDLPWSVRFNRKQKTVQLQAFSYSKLLENASAESVRRSVTGLTGSVTAASQTVTVSPDTTNLRAGDQIELRDNTNQETQVILKVLSSSQVKTIDAWANTFAGGTTLTCLTPYHRDKGIQELMDLVLAQAGLASSSVSIITPLAAYPIATPMNTTSYPLDATTGLPVDPKSFMPRAGIIQAILTDGVNTRAEAATPASAWSLFTTGLVTPRNDWTPYYDVEPANFPAGVDFDDGKTFASDHETNDLWELELAGANIKLRKNGAASGAPDIFDIGGAGVSSRHRSIEVDPVGGGVWMSLTGKTTDAPDKDGLKVWDGAVLSTLASNFSGEIRYLRRLNVMAIHEYDPEDATNGFNPTTNMRIYDRGTGAVLRTVTVPENLWGWSLRVFRYLGRTYIAGLYLQLGTTRLRLWDTDWNQVADYEVAGKASGVSGTRAFLTVITQGADEVLIGSAGSQLFVLGNGYAGVVPYADFEGASCASAMRDLALVSAARVEVDEYKIGTLRSRADLDEEAKSQAIALGPPLEEEVWPVSEFYRTSCKVSGQTPAGDDVLVISGDTSASARRLELSSNLVSTGALAAAVGSIYVGVLSRLGRQSIATFRDVGRRIRNFRFITHDGSTWQIVEASHDIEREQHQLKIVEVLM
ncbi:MAG TPA: hypothetical protein VFG76_06850 [Candidatus Polarisedimenticolia bacterium]|nr:hypothetical protein [Candidatus Polarisedimenticolia bacterium]